MVPTKTTTAMPGIHRLVGEEQEPEQHPGRHVGNAGRSKIIDECLPWSTVGLTQQAAKDHDHERGGRSHTDVPLGLSS